MRIAISYRCEDIDLLLAFFTELGDVLVDVS